MSENLVTPPESYFNRLILAQNDAASSIADASTATDDTALSGTKTHGKTCDLFSVPLNEVLITRSQAIGAVQGACLALAAALQQAEAKYTGHDEQSSLNIHKAGEQIS